MAAMSSMRFFAALEVEVDFMVPMRDICTTGLHLISIKVSQLGERRLMMGVGEEGLQGDLALEEEDVSEEGGGEACGHGV